MTPSVRSSECIRRAIASPLRLAHVTVYDSHEVTQWSETCLHIVKSHGNAGRKLVRIGGLKRPLPPVDIARYL